MRATQVKAAHWPDWAGVISCDIYVYVSWMAHTPVGHDNLAFRGSGKKAGLKLCCHSRPSDAIRIARGREPRRSDRTQSFHLGPLPSRSLTFALAGDDKSVIA